MNKVLIVIMFILLGTSLIVVSNMSKGIENSFTIEYQNNKNLALPDLTNATEIADGVYQLFSVRGLQLTYNVYTGIYTRSGTLTPPSHEYSLLFNLLPNESYTITTQLIQQGNIFTTIWEKPDRMLTSVNNETFTFTTSNNFQHIFLNYNEVSGIESFKLQLENGTQSTSYVVPKLIPVYKDNLTQQEKNEIGIGAFGGITKIIKTISDIIKPVGDFINGILSIF